MIEEEINSATEELKRADHLIYVSLKYTRTGDVIKSVISRLMSAQELVINGVLEWLEKKRKLKNVDYSKSYRIKSRLIKEKLGIDKILIDFLNLYDELTAIMRSDSISKEEFRKNVRIVLINEGIESDEINIERLKEYYRKTMDLVKKVELKIK